MLVEQVLPPMAPTTGSRTKLPKLNPSSEIVVEADGGAFGDKNPVITGVSYVKIL
jgi:hypothetical protein